MATNERVPASGADAVSRLRTGALIGFMLLAPAFALFPQIDTDLARLFFTSDGTFSGSTPAVEAARNLLKALYIAGCLLSLAGVFIWHSKRRKFLSLTGLQHLFLITCLAVGPGLVTNLIFKDHWGRARPREIVLFGGEKSFTPALQPARQCTRNCSFVSGEASSMFMLFFALAPIMRRRSNQLIAAGLVVGTIAGLIRMAQGGHFASDVAFAAIAMAMTVVGIHRLFCSYFEAPALLGETP